jgi:hypothetical protein
MAIKTSDGADRLPTTGPNTDSYERYSHISTDEGDIIYDKTENCAWILAEETLDLEAWQ